MKYLYYLFLLPLCSVVFVVERPMTMWSGCYPFSIENHETGSSQLNAEIKPLVDHHTHIFSPAVNHRLETKLKLDSLPSLTVKELIAVMQKDGVAKASVLSNAYLFVQPGENKQEDMNAMMAENDSVATAVAEFPNQLVAFFSINPLADTAITEIERCTKLKKFVGLKLHLANSEVSLRNPIHVARLGEIFEKANAFGLEIVIHLRTHKTGYNREDALIFIDKILPKAPDINIQIAHAAGWGGYDQATDDALGAFADRIKEKKLSRNKLYFDVSAVVREVRANTTKTEGISGAASSVQVWQPEKRYERLAERLRQIGLDRILFATDWPEWTPQDYLSDIKKNLPLKEDELQIIVKNRANWLN